VDDSADIRPRREHGEVHWQLDARLAALDELALRRDERDVLGPERVVRQRGRRDGDELTRAGAGVPLGAAD
jgi:hypothetical protein